MYAEHVPIICTAMRAKRSIFARGVMFALLSARVQFPRVPDQCRELAQRKEKADCLWGWKFDAYQYVTAHRDELWENVTQLRTPEVCITELCTIPGMGIVKAAFVAQMLGYDVACMDVRNMEREGFAGRPWRTDGKDATGKAYRAKIGRYVAHTAGRAQELWDTWCNEVGRDYGLTGELVSKIHVDAIVGSNWQRLDRFGGVHMPKVPLYPATQEVPF